jgi:hypothetical protein
MHWNEVEERTRRRFRAARDFLVREPRDGFGRSFPPVHVTDTASIRCPDSSVPARLYIKRPDARAFVRFSFACRRYLEFLRRSLDFDRRMHNLTVLGEILPDSRGGQRLVVGDDARGARAGSFPYSPGMQVHDARVARVRAGLRSFAHLAYGRMVHFPVKQDGCGLRNEVLCPCGNQNGARDPHYWIELRPSMESLSRQRDDSQDGRGRVGDDMRVSGFQIQDPMMMPLFFVIDPIVLVVARPAEDHRANDIHDEADGRDNHGVLVENRLRGKDPSDGADNDQARDAHQKNGAGKSGKNFNFPYAEGESPITGVLARGGVRKCTPADGDGTRTHVPSVGNQSHRVEPPSGALSFHDHHAGGDPHDGTRASFRRVAAFVQNVLVGPVGKALGMHTSPGSVCGVR